MKMNRGKCMWELVRKGLLGGEEEGEKGGKSGVMVGDMESLGGIVFEGG